MNIAEVILAIRAWAIWRRCRIIGTVLIILAVIGLAFQSYCIARFGAYLTFATPPFEGYRGCFIVRSSPILIWNYVILIIIEAVVLMLMIISAIQAYVSHEKSELLQIDHRDGIMAYVYILCTSIANSLIIKFSPPELIGLLSPMEAIIYSVLTCRVVFNIRQESGYGTGKTFDLHTTNRFTEDESVAFSTVIRGFTTEDHHQWI